MVLTEAQSTPGDGGGISEWEVLASVQPFGLSPLVMKESLFSGLLKRCVKELMGQVLRQGQPPGVRGPLREGEGPWRPGAGEECEPTVQLTTWFDFYLSPTALSQVLMSSDSGRILLGHSPETGNVCRLLVF